MEKARSAVEEKEEARVDLQRSMLSSEAAEMGEKAEERKYGEQIPLHFRCPLSLELMSDPVIVASGQTYERPYIQQWLDQGNTTCPKTGQTLTHSNLIPSYTVKALIANWCETHDIPLLEPGQKTIDKLKSTVLRPHTPFTSKMSVVDAEEQRVSTSSSPPRHVRDSLDGNQNRPRERIVANISSPRTSAKSRRTFHSVKSSKGRESERNGLVQVGKEEDYGERTATSASHRVLSRSRHGGVNLGRTSAMKEDCDFSGKIEPAPSPRYHHHQPRPKVSISGVASSIVQDGQGSLLRAEDSSDHTSVGSPSPNQNDVSGELSNPSAVVTACNEVTGSPARPESRIGVSFSPQDGEIKVMSLSEIVQPSPVQENLWTGGIGQHQVDGLVLDLESLDVDVHRQAAAELRLLAKYNMENRIIIANSGAIKPLVALLRSSDPKTQENAVTALLNLSIYDSNKSEIAAAGAINPLVDVLKVGSEQAMENAAAALLILSVMDDNKVTIGASGAIPPLIHLLINGSPRGKKDAATALFNLSMSQENTSRIVIAGAIKPLVELAADPVAGMVDKAVSVLANLATHPEGRGAIGEEGGIPALVDVVDTGSKKGKENAAAALLQLCVNSNKHGTVVLQEGAIPPLVALSQSGTSRAKEKASALLRYFREQRLGQFIY